MQCTACGFANPEGFGFCGKCGATLTSASLTPPPTSMGAERRPLTVLFCDLVDSTQLSERLDPEELGEVLRDYQETSAAVIDRYDGHVAQYLGDGLLVYFGFPVAHEDDALRAVLAGLEIIDAMARVNGRLESEFSIRIALRVGIHTGLVVTDLIGSDERGERLALGQVPNIAARMQGLAEPDTVLLGEATAELIGNAVVFERIGMHQLKGIREPMTIMRAVRESARVSRYQSSSEFHFSAGRATELAQLKTAWQAVIDGRKQYVLVSGEAGLGKSHLAHSFRNEATQDGAQWLTWQCSPFNSNRALFPVIKPTADMLGLDLSTVGAGTGDASALETIDTWLKARRFDYPDAIQLLAGFLSIPLEQHFPALEYSPQRIKERTTSLLLALIEHEAARTPLILLVEDLHWVDPSTLDLLCQLILRDSEVGLLILGTARPEFAGDSRIDAQRTDIHLSQLSHAEARELVHSLAGSMTIAPEIVETIVKHADGVPLFMEELTKSLISDSPQITGATLTIPATLHGLLSARLDRLGEAKEIAQVAAVIGRRFRPELLACVLHCDPRRLDRDLRKLIDAELLQPDGDELVFRHALIQDAAYDSLLRKSRRRYHRAIADELVANHPQSQIQQPEVAAHHYTHALAPEQAVPLWLAAAQREIGNSSNLEAINHLERAISLLNDIPAHQRAPIELNARITMGSALMGVRGYGSPELGTHYARALELAEQMPDAPERFWPVMGLCYFHLVRANFDVAIRLGEELVRLGEVLADPTLQFGAQQALGMVRYWVGDIQLSARHLEQAMQLDVPGRAYALVSPTGEDPRGPVLAFLAWCRWHQGNTTEAVSLMERSCAIAEESQFPFGIAYVSICRAMLMQHCGDRTQTRAHAQRTIAICQQYGFFFDTVGNILTGWADSPIRRAEVTMQANLDAYRMSGARMIQTYYLSLICEAAIQAGDLEYAESTLQEAIRLAQDSGERCWLSTLRRQQGEISLRRGDLPLALTCLENALVIAKLQGSKAQQLLALTSIVRGELPSSFDAEVSLREMLDEYPESDWNQSVQAAREVLLGIVS